jgi:polar amino acid transport system substrate-binding protein
MKKSIALGLSLIMTATLFAGCGSSTSTGSDASSKVTANVIDINLTDEEYAFGVDKDQPELLAEVNTFIQEIKDDGTLDDICNNYFGDGTPNAVTSAELDSSKDQLVIATNAAFEPFEYTQGDSYYGIDMEIAAALAEKLGKELVISNMDFDAVCLSIGQHKCDIAIAGLTIKEDRKEYVDFSDPYYSASQKLIVRSDDDTFNDCTDAASVEAILSTFDSSTKIGVQNGTTGQFYCEGDADWGFDGFDVTTVGYRNGSLAVQDLLNGNIQYVVIDSAPASCITEALNALQ